MQKRQKERGEEIITLYRELVMLLDSSKLVISWLKPVILEDNVYVKHPGFWSNLTWDRADSRPRERPRPFFVPCKLRVKKGRFERLESWTIFDQIKKSNILFEDLIVSLWNI